MDAWLHLLATLAIASTIVMRLMGARLPVLARAAIRLAILGVLTHLIFRLFGSPLQPRIQASQSGLELWSQLILTGWWAVLAHSAVSMARLLVVLQDRPPEAQIVVDLLAGAIYSAAGLCVVTLVFSVPLGGLLATSGIIAIVLGLALQSTLSDVFSGLAVGIERPFKAGDVVWIEGGIEGTILQVNWRSTHVATGPDHVTIVPNSVVAKARVVNHSRPTPSRMDQVEVRLDPAASSRECIRSLTDAAHAAMILLDEPRPMVVQKGLEGDGATYSVHFAVADSDALPSARTELYGLFQCHLRHAGISLAVRGLQQVLPTTIPDVAFLLERSDLFGSLPPEGRAILSEQFREMHVGVGERVICEGEMSEALFILASGTVQVTRAGEGERAFVHRMSPGSTLGAIGLVTGANYAASAAALTPVRAYRLDRAGLTAAIERRAALLDELEAMAVRGQAALSADAVASTEHQREAPDQMMTRVRQFLKKLTKAAVS